MPYINTKTPSFKKRKDAEAEWDTFKKGLNLLLRPTELGRDELALADNIMLTGEGVPTGRWGTVKYFTAGATGSIRGFGTYKSNDGMTNEVFALTNEGYLQKKNNTASTVITGISYPSGSIIHSEQLGGKTYIVSEDQSFVSYDGSSIEVFATISAPTGVSATNFSGASGPDQISYKVVAIGVNGGQTTGSTNYVLNDVPIDLKDTEIHIFWSAPSAASLGGYEIYRGSQGDERFLAGVSADTLKYVDRGEPESDIITVPQTNTTGGVKSKFIKKYKDRLLAVDANDPNKLLVSGRYPNHTKFNWLDGGGYVYIDPDSGDNITGVEIQPISDRIVVYKNYASYQVELTTVTIGNFLVLDPQYSPVSTSVGCSSQETIQTVENDTFYFGKDGIYVTGYEPNFLNIIRTNETSAKIRPYLEQLSDIDFQNACALYVNNKYILSFPDKKEMIVYDRERGAFVGPWKLPFGIAHMKKYVDSNGTEHWMLGSKDSNIVYEFSSGANTDDGTAIIKKLRTNKEAFGDWTLLSIVKFFYTLFRAIVGTTTVNIIVEGRDGSSSTIKSFTITGSEVAGSTGWGMDKWGLSSWGIPNSTSASTTSDEITRWGSMFKQSRLLQVEVIAEAANANFELLKIKITAAKQSRGSLSSSQRV